MGRRQAFVALPLVVVLHSVPGARRARRTVRFESWVRMVRADRLAHRAQEAVFCPCLDNKEPWLVASPRAVGCCYWLPRMGGQNVRL